MKGIARSRIVGKKNAVTFPSTNEKMRRPVRKCEKRNQRVRDDVRIAWNGGHHTQPFNVNLTLGKCEGMARCHGLHAADPRRC